MPRLRFEVSSVGVKKSEAHRHNMSQAMKLVWEKQKGNAMKITQWNHQDHEQSYNDRAYDYALPTQCCSGCGGSYTKRRREDSGWLSGERSENEIRVVYAISEKKKSSNTENKNAR